METDQFVQARVENWTDFFGLEVNVNNYEVGVTAVSESELWPLLL